MISKLLLGGQLLQICTTSLTMMNHIVSNTVAVLPSHQSFGELNHPCTFSLSHQGLNLYIDHRHDLQGKKEVSEIRFLWCTIPRFDSQIHRQFSGGGKA